MKTKLFLIGMLASIGSSTNAQWQTTNGPFSGGVINTLYANASNIFCGTASGGAFIYNGTSWSSINTGLVGTAPTITSITGNGTDLYCTSGGSIKKAYLSTNSGSNWDSINTGLNNNAQTITVSGTNLFAGTWGGATGGVFESTNNGSNWTALVTGFGFGSGGVHGIDVNDTDIIACVYSGAQVSTNSGNTWNWNSFNSGYISYCIARSGSTVFVGTEQGVYLTTDNGNTWTTYSSLPGNAIVYSIVIDGSNIFAGSDSGVFVSSNNSLSWTSVNTGLPTKSIYSLAINNNDLYVGTGTQGVWKRPLSQIESGIEAVNSQYTEVTIYPNPVNKRTTVTIKADSKINKGEIIIYNTIGQEVARIKNFSGQQMAFDIKGLSSGIYFVTVKDSDKAVWNGKLTIAE